MKICFLVLIQFSFSFVFKSNRDNSNNNDYSLLEKDFASPQIYIHKINSTHFSCDNNTKIFPLEKFNDNFCDCEDGSDENKTNACHNGKFFCNNYLYKRKVISTSKLNDGICDCCDGSDEFEFNNNCPNKCLYLSNIEYKKMVQEFDVLKATLDSYSEESTKQYFNDTFNYIKEITNIYNQIKNLYKDKILIERYINSKTIKKDESKISRGDLDRILTTIDKKINLLKKDLTEEEDNIHSLIFMGAYSELLGQNKLKLNFEDYSCELTKNKFYCSVQYNSANKKNINMNFGQLSYIKNNVAFFNNGYDCKGYPGVSLTAEIIFLCGKINLFKLNYNDNYCFYSFFYYTYLACNNAQINNIINDIDDIINH